MNEDSKKEPKFAFSRYNRRWPDRSSHLTTLDGSVRLLLAGTDLSLF
jgi:hypothetical protein